MAEKDCLFLAISDFNLDNFVGYMANDPTDPHVSVHVAPYGQVFQSLMDQSQDCWKNSPDYVILWTQAASLFESFRDLVHFKKVEIERILDEVDAYAALIKPLASKVSAIFIPTWVQPGYEVCLGMLDFKNGIGIANTLMRMNLRLSEQLESASNVYLLNTQRWVESAGKQAFNDKLWYMAKVPFGNKVFQEAVKDVKSALRGLSGQAKKLLVLDLDNTLWGGVVGDIGWENLILGGHDPVGEALVDFQKKLKSLTNRGVLLGIVSKNEEATALEAIQSHPEMVLALDDFAGWRINWMDKAKNIVDLVSELNLGLQSVVFIDDNPVERARVREALPEVEVPEWPEDVLLYPRELLGLTCFNTPAVSEEDLKRTEMYVSEKKRSALKQSVHSLDEWLKTLNIRVSVSKPDAGSIARTGQLLNKTNQMNLSTRRMTELELVQWLEDPNHHLWTFRVSDKFGDSGLTGIVSLQVTGDEAVIVDFILSCRVIGRKIEETMVAKAIHFSKDMHLARVKARYVPTPKNKPCLEFLKRSGFTADADGHNFYWEMDKDYLYPEQVFIEAL